MTDLTPLTFVALMLLGFCVGLISGFSGVGGGALLVPALVRIAGLSWAQANGLSLTQMIPTSAMGAWKRYRAGEVHPALAAMTLVGSIPGAWLGRSTVKWLEGFGTTTVAGREIGVVNIALTLFFSATVIWMSIGMVRGKGSAKGAADAPEADQPPRRIPWFMAIGLGLIVGYTSSLLGIGGGFLFVPVAIQNFGMPVALAVGTSLFQMPVTASTGAFLYWRDTAVPYTWLIPLLIGSLTGVSQGIALSKRFDNRQYRIVLGYVLMGIAVLVLLTIGK